MRYKERRRVPVIYPTEPGEKALNWFIERFGPDLGPTVYDGHFEPVDELESEEEVAPEE